MGITQLFDSVRETKLEITTILAATTLAVVVATLVRVFLSWRRLRHIPGPFLNSITPLVLTYHCLKEDITTYTYKLGEKYGPLVRIGPNMVMFWDAETFRYICSVKAGYTKGLWFEFSRWDINNPSSIAMRDNESRKVRKGQLSPAFVGPGLALMESRVDNQVRAFLDLVERKYITTPSAVRPMEFGHRAQYFTLDVATNVTFGEPFGFLKKDGDVEKYLEIAESMLPMFGILGTLPWLVYVMHSWPVNKMLPNEGDKIGFGRLMKFAGEAVKKRLETDDDADGQHDLIRAFLRNGIAPADAVQECITLIVAGTETTSVGVRMTMLALLTAPEAYRKLQAEIDEFYAKRNANDDSIISFSEARSLPYLQGVIREGLRLWPPSAGLFSKEVPKTGDTIHGYYLPPGTEIGQSVMGVGRQPGLWGPDADIFRPERWVEASGHKLQEMISASDLVFSSGKYICLGKNIAWMELTKLFTELLRRYDIAIHNPTQPMKVSDPVVWIAKDFWIRFTKREK